MQGNSQASRPMGMQHGTITRYRPAALIDLPERQWPTRILTAAPNWCSVDLRDGNQALPTPMSVEEKLEMFKLLVAIGFKEIEVAFPSSSQIEFDFVRRLIDEGHIPDDVTIQVLTQARSDLIQRTFDAIRGAKRAVVHLYNSTSPQQRRIVFGMEKPEIIEIAARGTRLIKDLAQEMPETQVIFEYTPESFALTEIDFSLEICEAVMEIWQPTRENKLILNLPETVQIAMPNIHADQIEWMCRHLRQRELAIISVHTHNDRGTGVASAEQALLAGAERIEGTLFGNGERTGNVDLVTLALNMYMQGIDPGLDFGDLEAVRAVYEKCTHMVVPQRQPYAGELVFTAFSGSHQDAIRKGMAVQDTSPDALWEVPYLPIDPRDLGRNYEAIIRINSQSGKGGVAYIMESEFGLQLPKKMHAEFGKVIKALADARGNELTGQELFQAFTRAYLENVEPFTLEELQQEHIRVWDDSTEVACKARIGVDGVVRNISGRGDTLCDAFVQALKQADIVDFEILSSTNQAASQGIQATAFVEVEVAGRISFGAALEDDADIGMVKALVSALNRAMGEA